ncbi:MAG: ribose-phosphate diphosphokinase, partial [Christensenellales bacterium]
MLSAYGEIKIFAGSTGINFARRLCKCLSTELGNSETIQFSDGNLFVKVNEPVRDKDVYLLQPIANDPNKELVEILFWMDAFKRASANSVTAIIPYFSYAKGDKKDEPRVSIRARVCAETIELAGADRVVTMDLHSPQVQGFFKKPVDHLMALTTLCEYINEAGLNEDLIVVSPDAGYAKSARKF